MKSLSLTSLTPFFRFLGGTAMAQRGSLVFLIGLALTVSLVILPAVVFATPVDVEGGGKSKDVRFRVFSTFLTFRFGDPIVDEDLPAGNKKTFTIDVPFVTDISTEQRIILPDGTTRVATNDWGTVIPDPANPGQFTMPPLGDFLAATFGMGTVIGLPDLSSDDFDLFIFTDIGEFVAGGGVEPTLGTSFNVINGESPSLPGVEIGLAEIHLDPNLGLVNSAPFTGLVSQLGIFRVAAVPEPSTALLLFVGLGALGFLAWRRRPQQFGGAGFVVPY